MPDHPTRGAGNVLRHPDLRRYLSARFLVMIGTQVQTVAVGCAGDMVSVYIRHLLVQLETPTRSAVG